MAGKREPPQAGLAAFSLSGTLVLSLVCLAVAGFGAMAQVASSNTILQTIVEMTSVAGS